MIDVLLYLGGLARPLIPFLWGGALGVAMTLVGLRLIRRREGGREMKDANEEPPQ